MYIFPGSCGDPLPHAYAELHCLSNFSFLRGASHPEELVARAAELGMMALALTDECSFAGVVRAHQEIKRRTLALKLIVGTEIRLDDGPALVLLARDRSGYANLSRLISRARRACAKGAYRLARDDLAGGVGGCIALLIPPDDADLDTETTLAHARWLGTMFADAWIAIELAHGPDDTARLAALQAIAHRAGLPCVAATGALMHEAARRPLADMLAATRMRATVMAAGLALAPNAERRLHERAMLATRYPPELLAETLRIAARCTFSLDELRYEYPAELVPEGWSASGWLRHLVEEGLRWRYRGREATTTDAAPRMVRDKIEYELALIAELGYEAYFLTVHDIVRFARSQGILCQGRGSAANSVVCWTLGITEVDPELGIMLVERFISRERNEPPDIDVDFEHERREEVIQYVFRKYGRDRAALAATVICYRGKSAVRDVARALGLPPDQVDQLSRCFAWWDGESPIEDRLRERGFDPDAPVMRRVLALTRQLLDAPRHLSQHVGGFVISGQPLHHLVPVQNAAMPDRTLIEWDKDDLESLGLLKVDCLALGMLTAVSKCLALLREHRGRDLTPATIPAEDPATYAMIRRADTVGVFQIESRAQMAMLPRLKPRTFYDLVVQVAIVRPGPIQGKMVHPYLQRRQGLEPVTYPSAALEEVFRRTLGVPLFQEQVMQVAIVAAGFSAGEADELRRGMAAWKRRGGLEHFRDRLFAGLAKNGYDTDFAERIFEQIRGFGSYGFPESHAASFALITYTSCWLKCHEPAAFTCALMNSQPLGFYSNSQLVQDVRRGGIVVRPVDVRHSHWDNSLEAWPGDAARQPALRLGLREIAGLPRAAGEALVAARAARPFDDVAELCHRAGLDERARSLLAEAGALKGLAGHRHRARWAVGGVEKQLPLFDGSPAEDAVSLPVPSTGEDLLADYARIGLTLGPHPLSLLRRQLAMRRYRRSRELRELPHGSRVRAAGLVTMRQRPETASGTTFITLEDEDGMVNVVVWRDLGERQRRMLIESRLLGVEGRWETVDGVHHLIASRLHDESALAHQLNARSRDFR